MTFEIAIAEDDPYDRTLSCMIKSGSTIEMVRSMRIAPDQRLGRILWAIDRLALAAAAPELRQHASEHAHDVWDAVERAVGYGPFPE